MVVGKDVITAIAAAATDPVLGQLSVVALHHLETQEFAETRSHDYQSSAQIFAIQDLRNRMSYFKNSVQGVNETISTLARMKELDADLRMSILTSNQTTIVVWLDRDVHLRGLLLNNMVVEE